MSEPSQGSTPPPPRGWASLQPEATHRSPEEPLAQLIDLFRQLLTVAQVLLDLLEERVERPAPAKRAAEEIQDIPIL